MELIYLGLGGAAGSIARYQAARWIARKSNNSYLLATFAINISGAIALGIVSAIPGREISLLLSDGFLGAFTTFSTFMYEGFCLFENNRRKNALVYILLSLAVGVAGYALGYWISRFWF
jgi:fluoride exporter